MEVITIASAKGGVSKSLLAVNLFSYLKNRKNKKVLLIDTDEQKSAFEFLQELGEENAALALDEKEFKLILKQAEEEKIDFVVVDTAPTITEFNGKILENSHKVLIAVKPAKFDIKSIYNTIEVVNHSHAKSCILFTQTINNSTNTKKNIEELKTMFETENVKVLDYELSHSAVYVNAINDNKTIFDTKGNTKQKNELIEIFASLLAI
ncbi:hypothetical protein A1D22_10920 [Pasteurellaceae bacterium LFhippo2]|nr:hypothetical protein [Pasteurellaceae bacterium LFhippo2]